MKRMLSVLAICALCAVATTSPSWADEPTTTITAPAPSPSPVVLEPDTITVDVSPSNSAPVPTMPPAVTPVDSDLPADWGPADYARLVALEIMPTVVYIVSGLLLALAAVGIYYLRKYTGIDVSQKQLAAYSDVAGLAWKTVEERLRAGVLKLPDGTPPAGAQKLELALDVAQRIGQELQLPQMARNRLAEIIEAKLLEGRG